MSRDTDRLILEKLDDKDLFNTILTNKYFYSLTDENFWRKRLLDKYPSTLEYKKNETWKQYYLKMVYYIDKLQRLYDFKFTKETKGDPLFYYNFLDSKNFFGRSKSKKSFLLSKSNFQKKMIF